jgi:RNA polymerase sigma-70 factor (ECF subfamily)
MSELNPFPNCDEQLQSKCDDFVALISRHSRRIYGYIRTMVLNVNDANDVFQNATLCMWKKFDEFTIGTNFFAWACRIARLEVLKFKEKQRPQLFFSEDVINLLAQQLIDNGNELGSREVALNDCVKKLSRPDRQMLELRYYKERKPKQIAVAQSRSVFSVYRSLSRIHDQLFRCIERALSETSPS